MSGQLLSEETLRQTHELFVSLDGSVRATAKQLGISRKSVRHRLEQAKERLGLEYGRPLVGGQVEPIPLQRRDLPAVGTVKRYILTSAQNNTHVHLALLRNLEAYAAFHGAEILVSQYTYNKASYGQKAVKPGRHPTEDDVASLWYDDALDEYVCNARVELAPALVFCGEMNILPTAVRPLSSLKTHTGRKSCIVPHSKFALESVGAMAGEGAKLAYTTGTITQRNYIQKKEGQKADFHHGYGAVIVEVNSDGNWWVRQLNATEDGSFYDLDNFVSDEEVTTGHRVLALNYGDLHEAVMDPVVRRVTFGSGGMVDRLRPEHQVCHDTFDFKSRNHHEMKDKFALMAKWVEKQEDVRAEFQAGTDFLNNEVSRPGSTVHVVDSNHDNALFRWAREADMRWDSINQLFWHECNVKIFKAILERRTETFSLVEEVCRDLGASEDIHFLRQDESLVLAGVEFGLHGHLGVNGARGSTQGLSQMGRKANTGHTHSAQIIDGLYVAGTSSRLRLSYNAGPSSWSHSHVVTYPNGKRTIVTIWDGQWRA